MSRMRLVQWAERAIEDRGRRGVGRARGLECNLVFPVMVDGPVEFLVFVRFLRRIELNTRVDARFGRGRCELARECLRLSSGNMRRRAGRCYLDKAASAGFSRYFITADVQSKSRAQREEETRRRNVGGRRITEIECACPASRNGKCGVLSAE